MWYVVSIGMHADTGLHMHFISIICQSIFIEIKLVISYDPRQVNAWWGFTVGVVRMNKLVRGVEAFICVQNKDFLP